MKALYRFVIIKMSSETNTLAEVFLGFGGKTFYTLGTACTSAGVIYGIHRLTGLGINIFSNLPAWLGMKNNHHKQDDQQEQYIDTLISSKDFFDHLASYGKIALLITFGISIKTFGKWMGLDSTVSSFNRLLYK